MRDRKRPGILIVLLALVLGRLTSPNAQGGSIDAQLTTVERRQLQREARLVVDLLQNYHYTGRSFREIENKEMVSRFLDELDADHDFLTAEDVDFIHSRFDRSFKSVYLLRGDLQPAFEIFDTFITRTQERRAWIAQQLKHDFDFSLDEEFTDHRGPGPRKDDEPLDRRWALWLKEQVLREILRGRDAAAAVAIVGKHYDEIGRQIAAMDSLTVRERFFDSLIRSFDPHSGYFSADSAREFAVGMENAVAGAGFDLRKESGLCVVSSVQPGGPADLQSDIQADDIIDELRDGDGPRIDASERPLRELVALVRGEPGTKLRLTYHTLANPQLQETSLERTRVILGAERAHGAVSQVPDQAGADQRIGWINLPSFYAAGEGPSATSATSDVRELMAQMTTHQKLDGVVIDLRDNPGGALPEAVALSGLFLPSGVVMHCRNLDGSIIPMPIKENGPVFDGPLIVLTSPQSASASEIFAGAMKVHQRAVIVGGTATFGKGTVQNYIELAKAQQGVSASEAANWGTLRLTAQRFYQPDGKSVQRAGILSDIVLPLVEPDPASSGRESDLPHALAAESIQPPAPNPPLARASCGPLVSEAIRTRLRALVEVDINELPEWKLWRQEQTEQNTLNHREKYSLQLEKRKLDHDKTLTDYTNRVRARRMLTTQVSYATEPFEISLLKPGLDAHEAKLRAAKGQDGSPLLRHLDRGRYIVETDHGHLRALRLDGVDFRNYLGDIGELAQSVSSAAGRPVTADEIKLILQDLSLLEHKTDDAVLGCFKRNLDAGSLSNAAVAHAAESLLQRMAEIDGDMLRERPALDVPLRECLRAAAAWASSTPPRNAP